MNDYTDYNSAVIDGWTDAGREWGVPISHEVYAKARCGDRDVLLTPMKKVPHDIGL